MKKILNRLLKWRSKPAPAVAKAPTRPAHEIALKFAEVHRQSEPVDADAKTHPKSSPKTEPKTSPKANPKTQPKTIPKIHSKPQRPAMSEVPESRTKAGDKPAGARQRSDEAPVGPAPAPKAKKKRKHEGKGADRATGRSPAQQGGGSGLTKI